MRPCVRISNAPTPAYFRRPSCACLQIDAEPLRALLVSPGIPGTVACPGPPTRISESLVGGKVKALDSKLLSPYRARNWETNMKVFTTLVALEDSNQMLKAETIEHKGKLWLVPEWLEASNEGWRTPARIVLLDVLEYQRFETGEPADFVLNHPIPKTVFDGQVPEGSKDKYVVVELPGMRYPIPPSVH